MKKYYLTIKTELQRQLTHRIEMYAYRLADLFEVFALLFVWTIAYKNTNSISGFTKSEMITYVLVGWLFVYLSRGFGLYERVADDIFEGRVSDFLVKPISYLRYVFTLSFGRSAFNVVYSVLIQSAVMAVFSKYMIFNLDFSRVAVIVLMLGASYLVTVFMALIIGMIAFWTQRVIGIDYTIGVAIKFLSGAFFPISLLPESFLKLDKIFPFIYTMFIPAELYLGKISIREGVIGLGVEIIWVFILYGIIKIMWKRGLRRYEGVGI